MSFLRPLSIPTGSWVQVADMPMIIHRYVGDKVILFSPTDDYHVRCTNRDIEFGFDPSFKPAWTVDLEPSKRVTSGFSPAQTLDTIPRGERDGLTGIWVQGLDRKLMILTGFGEHCHGYAKCIDPAKEVTIVPLTKLFPCFDCERAWDADGLLLKYISGPTGR